MKRTLHWGVLPALLMLFSVAATSQEVPTEEMEEIVVLHSGVLHADDIRFLVEEAKGLLERKELDYVFVKEKKREVLRGRPVMYAAWSEKDHRWHFVELEVPVSLWKSGWKPGDSPPPFRVITEGYKVEHDRGLGAERLMFRISYQGERLRVFGRKFPTFNSALIARGKWRQVAKEAESITYLPFTEDAFDMGLVREGWLYLFGTANLAREELKKLGVRSFITDDLSLADTVPPEILVSYALIEQVDQQRFQDDPMDALHEVLNQYGLMRSDAFRFSVSSASAVGPMQWTDNGSSGTYRMIVRRCSKAKLIRAFPEGATDHLNAFKATACLHDLEVASLSGDLEKAYLLYPQVLGIFPVSAYNGGYKYSSALYGWLKKRKIPLPSLSFAPAPFHEPNIECPCIWRESADGSVTPETIPQLIKVRKRRGVPVWDPNENRWYIEKYLSYMPLIISVSKDF